MADTDIRFRRRGAGEHAVVFVHGFLDDQYVWDGALEALTTTGVETVQLDLAGCGERAEARGPFTLDRFVSEVGAIVDALDKPVVLIGHSMAAPIVELVGAVRQERVRGLALVTPVPLAGTHLPEEAIEPFRALGGDVPAQCAVRQRLSAGLTGADLDRLAVVGGRVRPEVVRALADCWNTGHEDGAEPSAFSGPVLVLRGADDGFITGEIVAQGVLPRFTAAQTAVIDGAGHWAHIEQPEAVAARLDVFLAEALTSAGDTVGVRPQEWTQAFDEKSSAAFGDAFAEDVALEASALRKPIQGREQVRHVMGTASAVYESLVFTHEAVRDQRTYLEWEATAFGGQVMRGVTILTKNEDGKIIRAAIHHRPLGAVLAFSAELRDRLHGHIDPDHFYDGGEDRG
ncbi:alpha/beta fold hydrolase [Streptomyces sp. NPDC001292]|uniref:alpha/beta fold hydrolase n=1 Tax=Streptomyces sp. NPDC001292 TaxID=3364558 RepID=UPI0036B1A9A0